MKTPDSFPPLMQSLKAKAVRLPDQTTYWLLGTKQVQAFKAHWDQRSEHTELSQQELKGSSWEGGPVLLESLFGPGLVFQSQAQALPYLPKLRQHGLAETEWFVSFAFAREETESILLSADLTKLSDDVHDLGEQKGLVLRLADGRGMWFSKWEEVLRFQEGVMELEGLL